MITPSRICLFLMLALWGLTACHPRDNRPEVRQRELMHTGFEDFKYWSPEVLASLTTKKAHSGRYAIYIDSAHEYSLTYHSELGRLTGHRPRRFTLGAWVWVPNEAADAALVFSISNPDNLNQPVFRQLIYPTTSGPFGAWKYVSRDFDVLGGIDITSKSQLAIYLWRLDSAQAIYVDDIQLTELW